MLYQVVYATLAVLAVAEARVHEEPECSKYHFEEKVLEKLVRLEHRVELYQAQLKIFDDRMERKISEFKDAEVERTDKIEKSISEINAAEIAWNDKLDKVKDSIQQELEGQKAKLDEVLSDFQKQVGRLSKDLMEKEGDINQTLLASIKTQETAVNKIKADLATPTVVFKVKTVADTTLSAGDLVRYTETVTNIGGGYDSTTGYFTAPHSGTFAFTVQVCAASSKYACVYIVAADIVIGATTQFDASGHHTCTTGTGVAVLAKADKVWIKSSYSSALVQDIYRSNSFSGVLIHTNTN